MTYGPLRHYTAGVLDATVVDPRFGTGATPTQPTGWGGGGGSGPWVDAAAIGMVGDGTTDNTGAWNSAMAALAPAGGTLVIGPGVFAFASAPNHIPGGVRVVGSGNNNAANTTLGALPATGTILRATATMTRLIQMGEEVSGGQLAVGNRGAEIGHLTIDGNLLADTAYRTCGGRTVAYQVQIIQGAINTALLDGQNCVLSQARISGYDNGTPLNINNTYDCKVFDCQIFGSGAGLPVVRISGNHTMFSRNHVWNGATVGAGPGCGLMNVRGQGQSIVGNTIEDGSNGGPELRLDQDFADSVIVGNLFYTRDDGVPVMATNGGTVRNVFSGNVIHGTGVASYSTLMKVDSAIAGWQITGNVGYKVDAMFTGTQAASVGSQASNNSFTTTAGGKLLSNNDGRAALNGTGSATSFTIPHGLGVAPRTVQVTPGSAAATGAHHVTADATNLTVTYDTAPATGTGNVVIDWTAHA